jgi:LuxR family maltose regulon positive regulatory protein
VAGLAFIGQANVLREWNDLDGAEELTRRSLELCKAWVNPSSTCGCYTPLARILLSKGDLPAAGEALRLAEETIRGRSPLAEVISDLNAARVEFWLAAGQLARASQWAREWQGSARPAEAFSVPGEQDEITLARVQLAEGKFEIALQTLQPLAAAAEAGGRMGHLVEICKLQALALLARGESQQALDRLQKCLALAEPEGYFRIFIDEGQPMRDLLLAGLHTLPPALAAYAQKLLVAFGVPGAAARSAGQTSRLVEPLTEREMDVLRLMGEGFSNHQIAGKLILAEGTIKFYVHAVLEKLGVHNRTQAVLEAKKQKII